jgi:nucleoporin NUP2
LFGSSSTSGFASSFGGFGVPKPAAEENSSAGASQEESSGGVGDGDGDGTTDDSKSLPTKSHDEEGEGEEDEVTTHTTKSKVYKLVRDSSDGGKPTWKDLGVGECLGGLICLLRAVSDTFNRYVTAQET